jgi:hypothetical protein
MAQRAVTQVRPNPGKMVSVGKFRHMAMARAQPPSSLHAMPQRSKPCTGLRTVLGFQGPPDLHQHLVTKSYQLLLSGGTLNTWRSGDDGRTVAERLQV